MAGILALGGPAFAEPDAPPDDATDTVGAADPPDLVGAGEPERAVDPEEQEPPVPDTKPAPGEGGPAPTSEPGLPVLETEPGPRTTVDGIPQYSSADVAGAPRPADAAAFTRGDERPGRIAAWPVRVVLLPLRGAWWLVSQPIRGFLYAYDRYELKKVFQHIFFNEEGTIGVFPVADFYSGFGVTVGVRGLYRDIFNEGEQISARASYGGRHRQQYDITFDSGSRIPGALIEASAAYDLRPRDRFFGLGNGDEVEPGTVTMPIDPLVDPTAVETRFRRRTISTILGLEIKLPSKFSSEVSSGLVWESLGDGENLRSGDIQLESIYDPMDVIGFTDGASYSYSELALRFDNRRAGYWSSDATPNRGWLVSLYGGYARGFGDDPSNYVRYGADVQRYIPLWGDMRILVLRAVTEAVTADIDEIPFVALPDLGGDQLLRGYDFDRFRDRIIGMGSVEYQVHISRNVTGYFFTDVGRPWRSWGDLSASNMRVGFGAGLQGQTYETFLVRTQITSSIDGDVFVNLSFDPEFNPREPLDEL